MFDTENFKFSPLFAEFFGHDLGIQEFPTTTGTAAEGFSLALFADGETNLFANEEAVLTPRTDPIRHGLSGFGRRNSLLVIYVAAVVQANLALFKSKGLRLHFSIYEMQSETEAGSGNSFQTTCDGALNTGIPGQVDIPATAVAGLPADIADLTNLAQCITAELQKNITGHKTELREANLAALMLFAEAIHAGGIDATEAFTTRGAIGKIQQPKIEAALAYIEKNMKDMITIERFFGQEVIDLVVTNPQKPQLMVQSVQNKNQVSMVEFDFVHLANGTPWAPTVAPGHTVSSAIPNHHDLHQFLTTNKLLEDGKIKIGAHIGITGLSLSAYDYVPLVLRYTSLIEPTETGYKINPENAEYYQGLLTFISRTGVPTPPRHIDAKHFANHRPILTSEEVHGLLLQKQFDWLSFWTVFLDANVARSLGKLPTDLHYRKSMEPKARMEDYARQTEAYMRGELAEVGLQRTGFWLVYGGQGFYANPAEAERDLVKKAPLTRTDRAGFLMRRGSLAEITSAAYVEAHSNKTFFDTYSGIMHNCIAASPPAIHYLVARMFELGVATHAAGDFNEIVPSLHRNDTVLTSLVGAVKEVVSGQPEYAKGRFLRNQDGKGLVHATDMGMGDGTRVMNAHGQSIIGMRWPDTSFLDAAVYGAASVAPMTVLLSSIVAQGIKQPAERLLQYYKTGLPSTKKFDEETALFKSVWREMQEKHAFLVLCEKVAGSALEYLEYTDKVFDSTSRKKLVDDLVQAKQHVSATDEYHKAVEGILAFNPPSVEEYFERFVDLSPAEIQSCWKAHMTGFSTELVAASRQWSTVRRSRAMTPARSEHLHSHSWFRRNLGIGIAIDLIIPTMFGAFKFKRLKVPGTCKRIFTRCRRQTEDATQV
ncbi:hypothetical protein DFH09DRAFT_1491168 [Mycena vulgaris]|nr:hypothetical protein DFH09DRAFT_1491168 [Mycena vulgaris]